MLKMKIQSVKILNNRMNKGPMTVKFYGTLRTLLIIFLVGLTQD